MELDGLLIVTTAVKSGSFIFLLVQGIRLEMVRSYLLVYVFLAGKFLGFWVQTIAILNLGPAHPQYYQIYYATAIPFDLLGLLILLRVFYLHGRPSLRRDWPLLAVLPFLVAAWLATQMHVAYRVSYVVFACQMIVGFWAISRSFFSSKLEVGDNLVWLCYGITVPAALQAVYQSLLYLGADWWPYDAFRVVNELTTAISWCMIAHGMRRYDPPRKAAGLESPDQEEAARRLKELTRSLWRWP